MASSRPWPLVVTVVSFRPDEGFPMCDGYMVGPDDGKSGLYPTPEEAVAAHEKAMAEVQRDK